MWILDLTRGRAPSAACSCRLRCRGQVATRPPTPPRPPPRDRAVAGRQSRLRGGHEPRQRMPTADRTPRRRRAHTPTSLSRSASEGLSLTCLPYSTRLPSSRCGAAGTHSRSQPAGTARARPCIIIAHRPPRPVARAPPLFTSSSRRAAPRASTSRDAAVWSRSDPLALVGRTGLSSSPGPWHRRPVGFKVASLPSPRGARFRLPGTSPASPGPVSRSTTSTPQGGRS